MKVFAAVAAGALLIGGISTAKAVVLLQDNFESYANTAAMNAAWNAPAVGPGTLDITTGNPGQSMFHPGGLTNKRLFTETVATDAMPIVWEFDMFWDGAGNKRISGGLRDNGVGALGALLEMGYYNASAEGSGFSYRTAIGAGSTNWHLFPGAAGLASANTWLHFKATVKASETIFEVTGNLNSSSATVPLNSTGLTYDIARFGGPSDLSSAGGGANFDNVLIQQIPEPVSLALLASGGLLMIRRRRTA